MLQPHPLIPYATPSTGASPQSTYPPRKQGGRWLIGLWAATLGLVVVPLPAVLAQEASVQELAQTELRPTIRLGDEGAVVEEVQAMLSLLGYHSHAVDGRFDVETEAAVQAFQGDVGLTADGIVGPATWERLLPTPSTEFTPPEVPVTPPPQADTNPAASTVEQSPIDLPTLRLGDYGPAVTRLQTRLQSLGFYNGALDGVFGEQTEAAVESFQQDARILVDGIVGSGTWTALLR